MKTMDGQLLVRAPKSEIARFRRACDDAGVVASHVVRDLCMAAISYMATHCPEGRWITPVICPYGTKCPKKAVECPGKRRK